MFMKAVVEIKGGFGNQIFQYAFANYLKTKGYRVTVNINKSNVQRFPLDNKNFGFQESSKFEVALYKFLYFVSQKSVFKNSINKLITKIFKKEYNFEFFLQTENRYFNHFDGYWQNIDLIKNQKKYLIESLKKMKALDDNLNQNIHEGKTLVHVRRGDYVDVGENLNIKFYEESITYCKKNIKNFSFEVFTDDVRWVVKQPIFNQAKAIHGPKDNIDDLLTDITRMFNFENFIIGNSTFSLIPALLSKSKTPLIIVADPWMKSSKQDLNFEKSWIKIKNY